MKRSGEAMKILIAADGSIYTERMLAHLAMQDMWLDRAHRYTVVHCVEPLPPRAGAYLDATCEGSTTRASRSGCSGRSGPSPSTTGSM